MNNHYLTLFLDLKKTRSWEKVQVMLGKHYQEFQNKKLIWGKVIFNIDSIGE